MRPAIATVLAVASVCLLTRQCVTAASYYRWRSLNQTEGLTCSSNLNPGLSIHTREALVDILMFLWKDETNSTVPEICVNDARLTHSTFLEENLGNVCLNPHSSGEIHFIESFYKLMTIKANVRAISGVEALLDYQQSTRSARGYFELPYTPILTSGPSHWELAHAVYRLSVQKGWTYIVIMIEAEDGAVRLSQALQSMAKADQRVCFPLVITFTTSNATAAARALMTFAYPDIPRLTVVYSGSGTTFLSLWDLVTGSDPLSLSVDSEKRYQFVLVGDALGSFYRATDSARRRHFGLGTIFVFPGVLDRDPSSDKLAILLRNLSGSPESMGEFLSLTGTFSRLKSLRISTSLVCKWDNIGDMCYTQALMYDFQLLSFLPLFGSEPEFTPDGIERLRLKSVSLTDLRSSVPFVDEFLQQNFTHYSLARGLSHASRGFWQPIVKVYQSQLNSISSEATLVKLGELRVKQAGSADQSYEWDLSRTPELYQFRGGSADNLPVKADSDSSVCPSSCPECSKYQGKQFVEYKLGDLYIGASIPLFNKATDSYQCSDGTLDEQATEWTLAFRYVVKLAAWASEGGSTPPPGVDVALLDASFMFGLRDLVEKVQRSRTQKLKWGYVILDSCYSAPLLTNRLALLLNGKLEPLIGLNYTKFVGFVGDTSSTQTMAASEILKQYSLPIISFASTSTALSDVFQYPFTMRTVSSDNEIVSAMLTIIRHYKVDIITIAHATNAYGLSLRDAMLSQASRDGVCITKQLVLDCGFTDTACKRSLANEMRNAGTRYVAFLCDSNDLTVFLNYPEVEKDLEFITILATETIDATTFTGKNNLGVGTTMVQLVSAPEPGFLKYLNYTLTRMPANSNNLTQWDRLHFEMVHQCYLTDSFVRNAKYTQPCVPSIVASHQVNQLKSRSVFVMTATQTLILGCLTAINYLCSVVTPEPACPAFFKGDGVTQLQRANLIMYGQVTATGTTAQRFSGTFEGEAWSFQKIFENRMGRTPMRLMQFRKIGSAEYEFVQFGLSDGVNSSLFSASAEQLFAHERQATSSLNKVCRRWADCDKPKCVNIISRPENGCSGPGCTTSAPSPPSSSPPSLGLLGLLFLPGVLIGVLIFWFLRRLLPQFGSNKSDYAYADRSQTELAEASSIGRGNTDSCYYDTTDVTGNSTGTANRPLPEPSVQ